MQIELVKSEPCPMCMDPMPSFTAQSDSDNYELETDELIEAHAREGLTVYKTIFLCSESCRDAYAKRLTEKKREERV